MMKSDDQEKIVTWLDEQHRQKKRVLYAARGSVLLRFAVAKVAFGSEVRVGAHLG